LYLELRRLVIACAYDPASVARGFSIANVGACMTAVGVEARNGGSRIAFDVGAAETLAVTTLGGLGKVDHVNLEPC
jgi:riboflavin synthase